MNDLVARKERVAVAVSGGVDSSVAAALLVQQGYDVVGVTLQLRPCHEEFEGRSCCGVDAIASARGVCSQLGIPHYVLNVTGEFENDVLRPSWEEYAAGRTPNPCVHCNRNMKFGRLWEWAQSIGASKMASGHYAQVQLSPFPHIRRGLDPNKDQSYFLATLSPHVVERLILPIGHMSKPEVREVAARLGLPSASRKDSQDACFIPVGGSFPEYLRDHFGGEPRPGEVRLLDGRVVGTHSDARMFTVGQRKGLGIGHALPLFVVRIEPECGTVWVSDRPEDLAICRMWTSPAGRFLLDPVTEPFECLVQTRYRQQPTQALVAPTSDGRLDVRFRAAVRGISPGQLAVFYQDDSVVGSGTILLTASTDDAMG